MRNYQLNAVKLQNPESENHRIQHSRCIELLKREAHRPLIAIVAPTGYGKTTLLGAWAHYLATPGAIGWLSLDRGDNELHRLFIKMFIITSPAGRSCLFTLAFAASIPVHQAETQMTAKNYIFVPTGENLRGYFASIRSHIYFFRRDTINGMFYLKETEALLNGRGYLHSHASHTG